MKKTRSFSAEPESVAAARRFTKSTLNAAARETLEAIELMVSELATNCIRHTKTGFELTITDEAGQIRIEVTDSAGGSPRMRRPDITDPTGRGLQIVDLLSEAWGVEDAAGPGKTVWFVVATPATDDAEREERSERGPRRSDPDEMSTIRRYIRVPCGRPRLVLSLAVRPTVRSSCDRRRDSNFTASVGGRGPGARSQIRRRAG